MMDPAPSETDVFVIGGGPAGLAAALAARQKGFQVMVADRGPKPIDKACGEGLMPDGVAALRGLGVELSAGHGAAFRGIRFLDGDLEAEALFPNNGFGFGLRRTVLHRLMAERAESAGVQLRWQSPVEGIDASGVKVNGQFVRCRWIVGADGFHSHVRQWMGLKPSWNSSRRLGLRQHFRVEPWTSFVEVHWRYGCQAYVTPIGPDRVCVAMIGHEKEVGLAELPSLFPGLAKRLANAEPIGAARGAMTMSAQLPAVTSGRIALVGDASGSIDAVTGEGLHIAFRQASSLAEALVAGDLSQYCSAHRRIGRMPHLMARALLLMNGRDRVRRSAFRVLAAHPGVFRSLLAFHVGSRPTLSLGALGLAMRVSPLP